jgi:hypothetical protein
MIAAAGLAGVLAVLAMARLREARRVYGTPPEALLLDRALGLHDGLPAYLEGSGCFQPALESRLAAGLARDWQQPPLFRRNLLPLFAALLIALLPLALIPRGAATEDPPQIADEPESDLPQGDSGSEGATSENGEAGEGESDSDAQGNGGGGGDSGEPASQPGQEAPGGAGEAPEDVTPEPTLPQDAPQPGEAGEAPEGMKPPEPPRQPEIGEDLHRVTPEAGEGETTTVDRTRWIYNPQGAPHEGARPRPPEFEHPGERPVPRTKLTSRERRTIEELYRQLFE